MYEYLEYLKGRLRRMSQQDRPPVDHRSAARVLLGILISPHDRLGVGIPARGASAMTEIVEEALH